MPTYNEVVAPILMLPQLAPYLASHLLLPPWPILLEQAQYLASEPAVFYSQREGAMGIISERFAIELQRAPLDGAALFCPSLPSKGSEFFRHRTYTNPLQDIMLSRSPLQDLLVTRTTDSSLKWALFRSFTRDLLGDLPMHK